jgi:hypothetical protein
MKTTKATKPFVPLHIVHPILAPESRQKIRFAVDPWDDDGLYGQFPEFSEQSEAWKQEVEDMLKKVQEVLTVLHDDPELHCLFSSPDHQNMGWTTNQILMESVDPPRGWRIWCVNLGDNRNLALIFTQNRKLIITTDQFQWRSDKTDEFHWLLRHDRRPDGLYRLKTDSHRLSVVLKVLSDPERAKAYLLARLHCLESISD